MMAKLGLEVIIAVREKLSASYNKKWVSISDDP